MNGNFMQSRLLHKESLVSTIDIRGHSFAASVARKEGFEQISSLFLETAEEEKQHAKLFFKHFQGGEVTITAGYPAGVAGDTLAHLRAAAAGERHEWTTLYRGSAEDAVQEGLRDVAETFKQVAAVEEWHERRYNKLAEALQNKSFFKKPHKAFWKCRECGRVVEAFEAPLKCPTCAHPQAFFELYAENY
ncbi:MAG: rubrerythrin family protein [Deltaproteobacteria bacterium]|nr:rubrerythrin family protein [Deltaproteobacteria bacterium]